MTVFSDLQTLLETLGYKVFSVKKVDTVKQAIVYKSISQRVFGSMSGNAGLKTERIQVSCFAANERALKTMTSAVEDLLSFYSVSSLTILPIESKIEGFDPNTSTFYCFRDFYLIY